ncbi:MAG: uroporphyrinogen decarboxylase family protein [Holophaga sp.]|nr:uroporphyrinogen decarboxylase family protein [Holophaga sp.]
MPRDQMTPLERLAAYNRGAAIDRLPCVPIVGNTAARVIGVKVSAFRGDGGLMAQAQTAAYRRFGYDTIRVFTDLYTQAEAMGAQIRYPEDETAFLEAPAIPDSASIGQLRPADPHRDGNLPAHLEAARRVLDSVGQEVPVTVALTGPFTNASFLIGTENLVRLTLRQPEAVHRLCELSLQSSLAYAEAILATGAVPSLTDPMSSTTVVGPRQFAAFSLPYLARLVAFIRERGKAVTLHICGRTAPVWEGMADTGAACLSLDDDLDLAEAKRRIGHRVRLMGNVSPSAVMLQGSPAEVRDAVRKVVAGAADSPKGLVVASGCSLPTETPFANIDAMLDAVREIGDPARQEAKP